MLVPIPKRTSTDPVQGPCKASVIKQADQAYHYLVRTGCKKQQTPVWRIIWLGILAGVYIGIGYVLASVVAGQVGAPHCKPRRSNILPQLQVDFRHTWKGVFNLLYGAVGLPVGLTMVCLLFTTHKPCVTSISLHLQVVLTGADLFTSNTSYMTASLMEGHTGVYGLLKSWIISYFANLFGAILLVWMMMASDTYVSNPMVCVHGVRDDETLIDVLVPPGGGLCVGAAVQKDTPQLGRCPGQGNSVQLACQRT